jgi:alpha-N-arabinofuranosidase
MDKATSARNSQIDIGGSGYRGRGASFLTVGCAVRRNRVVVMVGAACLAAAGCAYAGWFGGSHPPVNVPQKYPQAAYGKTLDCIVDVGKDLGGVDRRIFGTNIEWFNDAGGLGTSDASAYQNLVNLARNEGVSVYRFPGGTLSDYYNWRDGIGPRERRPVSKHPTDSGRSPNNFGSPELFRFLQQTGGEALITVNAGTGTPADAAGWVAYANDADNSQRRADGFPQPVGVKLWEVGNEIYLPDQPFTKKVGVTPEVYAQRFVQFADAMRAVDPSIKVIGIGVTKYRDDPYNPQYPQWTEKLLQTAADKIDMIAVHNAYFPAFTSVKHAPVADVYRALWASPEAVDRSLSSLDALISRYERKRHIGIAITEWGPVFSNPIPFIGDFEWFDHVKTLGSGVYVGRLLQVFMSHPRVELANYFKFTDRTFCAWVNYEGQPKVPYWVFKLYARNSGDRRVQASVNGPEFNVPAFDSMFPEEHVSEVTVLATRASSDGKLYVNFVNRSMTNIHKINVDLRNFVPAAEGQVLSVSANEPTAHEGRDIAPEWPYKKEYEPYSTATPNSIQLQQKPWSKGEPVILPPFSVATLVLSPHH